jgi:hypothetical protein
MPKHKTLRNQPRIRDVIRIPSPSSLHPAIRRRVERDAARFNCSKSFVISSVLAKWAGVEQELYDE